MNPRRQPNRNLDPIHDDADAPPTFEERLLQEAFGDLLAEARRVSANAVDGAVLGDLEGLFLDRGRDLLRRCMENQLQATAEAAEKKGSRPVRTVVRTGRGTRGRGRGKS